MGFGVTVVTSDFESEREFSTNSTPTDSFTNLLFCYMEILFNNGRLLPKLALCANVTNAKNAIPILDCIKIEANANKKTLKISASDADTLIQAESEIIECDEDFGVCVDAAVILRTLQSIDGDTNISMKISQSQANFFYGNGKFSIPFYDANEFPVMQEDSTEKIEAEISRVVFSDAITRTQFAIGTDILRPVLNGIRFDCWREKGLLAAATDGLKLVKYTNMTQKFDTDFGFTLHKKPANLLKNLINALPSEYINIVLTEKKVSFYTDGFSLTTRLIEGNYPNYERVITGNALYTVNIGKQDLLNAIQRVAIMCDTASKEVSFVFSNDNVKVKAEYAEMSKSGEEKVACIGNFDGDFKISFAWNNIVEMLKSMNADPIALRLSSADRPMFVFINESEQIETAYLLAPLRPM